MLSVNSSFNDMAGLSAREKEAHQLEKDKRNEMDSLDWVMMILSGLFLGIGCSGIRFLAKRKILILSFFII